jgi:hypothetical protein
MIALICFVLAVLASPFKSKSRLEALGGFTIITYGLSFRYAHERIWLSIAMNAGEFGLANQSDDHVL